MVFLTVEFRDVPWVPSRSASRASASGNDCWRVRVRYGFMNRPDVSRALELCGALGLRVRADGDLVLPVAREDRAGRRRRGMALWRDRLFAAMARNAGNVTDYFNIPTNRVVELGTRVEI